jgi:hypothetical protein
MPCQLDPQFAKFNVLSLLVQYNTPTCHKSPNMSLVKGRNEIREIVRETKTVMASFAKDALTTVVEAIETMDLYCRATEDVSYQSYPLTLCF